MASYCSIKSEIFSFNTVLFIGLCYFMLINAAGWLGIYSQFLESEGVRKISRILYGRALAS